VCLDPRLRDPTVDVLTRTDYEGDETLIELGAGSYHADSLHVATDGSHLGQVGIAIVRLLLGLPTLACFLPRANRSSAEHGPLSP
jgi:hypothetical protein